MLSACSGQFGLSTMEGPCNIKDYWNSWLSTMEGLWSGFWRFSENLRHDYWTHASPCEQQPCIIQSSMLLKNNISLLIQLSYGFFLLDKQPDKEAGKSIASPFLCYLETLKAVKTSPEWGGHNVWACRGCRRRWGRGRAGRARWSCRCSTRRSPPPPSFSG